MVTVKEDPNNVGLKVVVVVVVVVVAVRFISPMVVPMVVGAGVMEAPPSVAAVSHKN